MQIATVDHERRVAEALLETGERGPSELLVVGVTTNRVAFEANGSLLEFLEDTEAIKDAAEVGSDLQRKGRTGGSARSASSAPRSLIL